jgi:hypothetical protein
MKRRSSARVRLAGSFLFSLLTLAASSGSARPQGNARGATWTVRTADYTEQQIQGDQVVQFTGDELAAPATGPYGMTVRRPPGVLRAGLLRPRVNFVPELLRSVENL